MVMEVTIPHPDKHQQVGVNHKTQDQQLYHQNEVHTLSLIEAGCPDLSMRDNYRFGGDDFDDPTTNVQRRALAIAKPISGGYWPRRSTINLTTKV